MTDTLHLAKKLVRGWMHTSASLGELFGFDAHREHPWNDSSPVQCPGASGTMCHRRPHSFTLVCTLVVPCIAVPSNMFLPSADVGAKHEATTRGEQRKRKKAWASSSLSFHDSLHRLLWLFDFFLYTQTPLKKVVSYTNNPLELTYCGKKGLF